MSCPVATAASSRIGLTVPTSLFAHITVTTATSAGFSAIAAARVSACTRPKSSTSSQLTSRALAGDQEVHHVQHRVVLQRRRR